MRRPLPVTHHTGTKWVIVVKDASLPIGRHFRLPLPGYFVRLEHGPNYLGPSVLLPKVMDWWWRASVPKALAKGSREARKSVERSLR